MISFKFKITNKQGKILTLNDHVTDPNNVFALQKYPTFQKEVKNNEVARTGQNNYWDFYSYYGKQTLGFTGVIVADNHQKLEQMKQEMLQVFALPIQPNATNDGYVKIEWTDDDGILKEVEAKLTADIQFDRALQRRWVLDFIIQLKTKDNFVRGGGDLIVQKGKRGYFNNGGIFLWTLLPISWQSQYLNILPVNITGVSAYPIIRLYGENQQQITNPSIKNLTTGETFVVNTTITGATSYIEINTETGDVKDHNNIDLSGQVTSNSSFITLVSGVNNLIYVSDETPLTTALMPEGNNTTDPRLTISYRQLYAN